MAILQRLPAGEKAEEEESLAPGRGWGRLAGKPCLFSVPPAQGCLGTPGLAGARAAGVWYPCRR